MKKEHILVVEDQPDIASLLKIYFTAHGYEVATALSGTQALAICSKTAPSLALLDVNLPDMEGYEIGRTLRAQPHTRHIPIIFLTARGERRDRLIGLGEVAAQYYIVKPFDIEEVYTIVKNQLAETQRKNQLHPVTNLPTADLISAQLRSLLTSERWAIALLHIDAFDNFTQSYGALAGEDVLRFTALLLREAVEQRGDPDVFVGQMVVGPDLFMTATPAQMPPILEQLMARFDAEIGLHYNFRHRQQGFIDLTDEQGHTSALPLMSLSIGVLTHTDGPFADIRELNAAAEEVRRHAHTQRGRSVVAYGRPHMMT